jgi:hypothetical protein
VADEFVGLFKALDALLYGSVTGLVGVVVVGPGGRVRYPQAVDAVQLAEEPVGFDVEDQRGQIIPRLLRSLPSSLWYWWRRSAMVRRSDELLAFRMLTVSPSFISRSMIVRKRAVLLMTSSPGTLAWRACRGASRPSITKAGLAGELCVGLEELAAPLDGALLDDLAGDRQGDDKGPVTDADVGC